jgi:Cu(I)/Ag(I) efflux system membrane protein CusA/SilA
VEDDPLIAPALIASIYPATRLGASQAPPLTRRHSVSLPILAQSVGTKCLAGSLHRPARSPSSRRSRRPRQQAETATDPARSRWWRPRFNSGRGPVALRQPTMQKLIDEPDRNAKIPGLTKISCPDPQPHDMLAQASRVHLDQSCRADSGEIKRGPGHRARRDTPGVTSALAGTVDRGRYIDINIDRLAAARQRDEHRGRRTLSRLLSVGRILRRQSRVR